MTEEAFCWRYAAECSTTTILLYCFLLVSVPGETAPAEPRFTNCIPLFSVTDLDMLQLVAAWDRLGMRASRLTQ